MQEKVQIERSASQRLAGNSSQLPPPQRQAQPAIDLFGDEPTPPRASTGPPAGARAPPKAEAGPPKQNKAGDSLLGLDFLGGATTAQPARPSSTGPAAATTPSRPDLKQSILSLYASKPAAAPQSQQHARQESFGSLAFPQQQTSPQQSAFGGMNDAFSSLSFNAAPAPKPSPFSGLDSFSSTKSPPAASSSNMFGGGGNFFDSKPKSAPQAQAQNRAANPSGGLGDFGAFTSPAPSKPSAPASGMNDLLDLSMPSAPAPTPAPKYNSPSVASPSMNSAFNLSAPAAPATPVAPKANPAPATVNYGGFSNVDAWGSNDVWGSSAPSQPAPSTTASQTQPKSPGWGAPHVAQDDDFGGWSSAAPSATTQPTTTAHTNTAQHKPAGGFSSGGDDLFSNVWE